MVDLMVKRRGCQMKKAYLSLFVSLLLFVCCFYTIESIFIKKIPLLSLDKVTVIGGFNSEKPGERAKIDQTIDDHLANNISYKLVDGKIFAAHYVYGFDASKDGNALTAYIWSAQREFIKLSGIRHDGAYFSNPMVVYMERNKLGNFIVTKCKTPVEGEEYATSIKELFPQEYQTRIISGENKEVVNALISHSIESYISSLDE
jgi:hypothetical protein